MNFNINSPIPDQWNEYVTNLPAGLEIIPGFQWDEEPYVSATTRSLSFFTSRVAPGGVQKNQNQTSMKSDGQLPFPEAMLIQYVRLKFKQPVRSDDSGAGDATTLVSAAEDLVALSDFGVVNFTIGEKKYGPYLPWLLPAASYVKGAFSTGSDLLANYMQLDGPMYLLNPNLMISPQQQFSIEISWPAGAITLSTGAESSIPIVVVLDGQRSRAIQ